MLSAGVARIAWVAGVRSTRDFENLAGQRTPLLVARKASLQHLLRRRRRGVRYPSADGQLPPSIFEVQRRQLRCRTPRPPRSVGSTRDPTASSILGLRPRPAIFLSPEIIRGGSQFQAGVVMKIFRGQRRPDPSESPQRSHQRGADLAGAQPALPDLAGAGPAAAQMDRDGPKRTFCLLTSGAR